MPKGKPAPYQCTDRRLSQERHQQQRQRQNVGGCHPPPRSRRHPRRSPGGRLRDRAAVGQRRLEPLQLEVVATHLLAQGWEVLSHLQPGALSSISGARLQ